MNVNVNLKPCDCPPSDVPGQRHESACVSVPIPIPCPIPRSVTFTVRLGECVCGGHIGREPPAIIDRRSATCPGKPIRVACSIGGKTWAESHLTSVGGDHPDGETFVRVQEACAARWEIVKALVTGGVPTTEHMGVLCAQRDEVYAALAHMAKAESTIIQRMADIDKVHTNRTRQAFRGVAADELAAYVEHLIEQMGSLP